MSNNGILFVTTTIGWAACEELWSQAALELVSQGVPVTASVVGTGSLHPRIQSLKDAGVHIHLRPMQHPLWKRAWNYAFVKVEPKWTLELLQLLQQRPPALVVFSEGATFPPIELLDLCTSRNLPFVTISHKNWDELWQADRAAEQYRKAFSIARRCYFVSEANMRLAERQIGMDISNGEVVRNPVNINFNASPPWPALGSDGELCLACVARLDPAQKGQDLLFEALAGSSWANRPWHLNLYGDGPVRTSLERLAARFGISRRISFAGHVASVEDIWASNHVLVMPSRYEGLPLAMVEAMLCGRPVVATDVAGHGEVITDGITGFLAGPPTVATVSQALERLWANRAHLEDMGKAGAKRIRELMPSNPGRAFSEKIMGLINNEAST